MPEIAEVEVQRTGIDLHFRGQTLREIEMDDKFAAAPADRLLGQKLHCVLRRGKLLGLEFSGDLLAVHLRMTGGFFLEEQPHTRARFLFDEPLYFSDPRQFATMQFTSSWASLDLGPDLWNVVPGWKPDARYLHSRRAIKTTLLDQKVLAGIGNYMADETLWSVGISPFRETREISDDEWSDIIHRALELSRAAHRLGGVSLRDYKNMLGQEGQGATLLQVYGRGGEPCLSCGSPLQKEKLGGRGTTWCPSCQV